MPYLIDDGTLDTVIRCECGCEHRFNFSDSTCDADIDYREATDKVSADALNARLYDEFVKDCIADVTDTCECHETEE